MIVFENIESGDTVGISRERSGEHYQAKLQALVNSSNLGTNSDRGQDHGWRLQADQQAELEEMRENPDTVQEVSDFVKVPVEDLNDSNFLGYMLYQEEKGTSPKSQERHKRAKAEDDYKERVKNAGKGKKEANNTSRPNEKKQPEPVQVNPKDKK